MPYKDPKKQRKSWNAWYRNKRSEAINLLGGKCIHCGYDKCFASLHFHHVDPKEKDPQWSKMRFWCIERLKDELKKCVLVCANCHGEIHDKLYNTGA